VHTVELGRILRADRSGAEHRLVEGNLETVGSRRNRGRCSRQTSVPGVFAAAIAPIVPYNQIVIAMGEGAKASLSAFDHLIRTPPARARDGGRAPGNTQTGHPGETPHVTAERRLYTMAD